MRDIAVIAAEPRLWIIGGCHVAGYKAGDAHPFWHGLAQSLKIAPMNIETSSFVSLRKCLTLLQSSERDRSADTLILQLGHHDLYKRLNSTIGQSSTLSDVHVVTEADRAAPQVSPTGYIKNFLEGYVGIAADLLLLNPGETRNRLSTIRDLVDAILAEARRCGFGSIVMVSPFPVGTARQNRHRVAGSTIMRKAAAQAGVGFVNAWDAVPRWPIFAWPVSRRFLADDMHLNAAGHRLLDDVLVAHHDRTSGARLQRPVEMTPDRVRKAVRFPFDTPAVVV